MPLGSPNDASREILSALREQREAAGLSWDGFGVQAQAMYAGGNPDRWGSHAERWRDLGATHLAIRTDSSGLESVDQHLEAMQAYLAAVS